MSRKVSLVVLFLACTLALLAVSCRSTSNPKDPKDKGSSIAQPPPPPPVTPPRVSGPISITSPADGMRVAERPIVEGTVSDPSATVWVVIHPMAVADYYVQPRTSLRDGGRWRVQVYVGRPGDVDVGKHFEILAVANPKHDLREGLTLADWPEAQFKSQVIEVIRGK